MQEQYNTDAFEASAFPISYTIVENAQGALTKTYEADETGTPRAAHRGALSRGIARLESSSGSVNDHLEQFENVLIDLKTSEAIVTGVPILDGLEWRLGTKADVENGEAEISRSSDCFVAKPAPSLMCLDLDTKTYPDAIRQRISEVGGVKAVLQSVFTGFQGAGCLSRPSASTAIENPLTGHETGSAGEHLYFVAVDGSDVADFAQRLHDRLVLSGWGWGEISKSGRVMTRTLIDRSATSPFRVVYEADAILRDMLEYKQPRRATVADGGLLDTRALTGLNDAETAALKETEAAIKDGKKAEAAAVRQEWKEERLRLSTRDCPDSARAAREMERAVEREELSGEFEIQFDDGMCATVSEILANKKAFHKRTCADPLEPDYGGGNNIAVLYTDHPARVWSQAHGGVDYRLVRTEFDYFSPVDPSDQIPIVQLTGDASIQGMFADSGKSDDRFECLSIDDIMELPDPDYAIDRHLPQESMGFLYGEPGCGKSFVALDWALHMAYGLPDWFDDKIITRPDAQVVYLAREGSSGFKARISAWRKSHLVPSNRAPRFSFIRQAIDFLHDDDIGKLERTVESAANGRPVDMVVVDTVSRVMPGADENLQKEMTRFVSACDRLKDRFGCIVLGVHHSAKSGDMRGSSVLRGAGDFVFKLEKQKDSDRKNLICEKQKDGPDCWKESYVLQPVTLGTDEKTGKVSSSLIVKRVNSVEIDRKTAKEAEQFAKVIIPVLGDLDRVKWTDLCSEIGERLREEGLVTQNTPRRVRDEVANRLSGLGVDLALDGQNVNLSFNKQSSSPNAPWVFEVRIVDEPQEAE